jgi:ABC-type branched-subunit amino acid transport system ATPase component
VLEPRQNYGSLFGTHRNARHRQGEGASAKSMGLLGRVGLRKSANQYAAALSDGQKKLLELLRAVSAQPVRLLLGERFAGVNCPQC